MPFCKSENLAGNFSWSSENSQNFPSFNLNFQRGGETGLFSHWAQWDLGRGSHTKEMLGFKVETGGRCLAGGRFTGLVERDPAPTPTVLTAFDF